MRFSQVHKFAVFTLAGLGLVALGAGGEMPVLSVGLTAVGVAASWWVEGDLLHSERYARAWNIALVVALAAQTARAVFFGAEALLTIVEFAALLQVNRLANRRTARDYQQITLLAILQLIAATVLGGGLSYALCFVGFVIATPWAMTLGHLRREIEGNYLADARAGRAGVPIDVARILRSRRVVGVGLLAGSSVLAVPIFMLTAVIFVLFPRIGLGILTVRSRSDTVMAGFGNSVDLSGHGTIRSDQTIVLRVQPPDMPEDPPAVRVFRLRGTTFDTYNGRQWSRRTDANDRQRMERAGPLYTLRREPDLANDIPVRIVLDPLEPPVVPVLEGAVGFRIDPRFEGGFPRFTELTVDHDEGVRYTSNDGIGLVYTAYLSGRQRVGRRALRAEEQRDGASSRYVQIPQGMSPRVQQLTEQITRGETTRLGKARAIERHLSRWRYTLELESGRADQPLEDFLFRTHAGHCEYFSTAMAVMLRTVGIPTRNVTGFLGGTFNRYGRFYAVRQGDAHSWVEVWDETEGWVTFDPTPPAGELPLLRTGLFAEADAAVEAIRMRWRFYVVDFDLGMQAEIAKRVWRFVEQRRRHDRVSGRIIQRGHAVVQAAGPSIPWRRVAGFGLFALTLGAVAWQLVAWRRIATGGARLPVKQSVRAAQDLARALDALLTERGVPRPGNRSPQAWARELTRRGDPLAPLVTRVSERYAAARFGDDALTRDELDALRAELKSAEPRPSA